MASRNVNNSPATAATRALAAAHVTFEGLVYEHDPSETNYGDEAARKLGIDPELVYKSLVITTDGGIFAIVVVPVARTADLKAVAAALGRKKAWLADQRDAERLTGYVLGGISPVGTRRRLETLLDGGARARATIYVSGGRRGFDIAISPTDLLAVTGGRYAPVGR